MMPFPARRRPLALFLIVSLLVLTATLLLGACANDQAASESTVSPSTSITALGTDSTGTATSSTGSAESSTTQPADTTTVSTVSTTSSGAATAAGQTTTSGAKPTTTAGQATTTTAKPTSTTSKPTTTTAKGPVALKISGPSGVKELSMADVKGMAPSSGYGGWKNDVQNISGPFAWKGVSLRALMDLVGGGSSVAVIASDGYEMTLSGGELGGSLTMFDPVTGEPIQTINGSVRAIIAYAKDGGSLSSSEGPLRLAFVSPSKDEVTTSKLWVRQVVELRVQ